MWLYHQNSAVINNLKIPIYYLFSQCHNSHHIINGARSTQPRTRIPWRHCSAANCQSFYHLILTATSMYPKKDSSPSMLLVSMVNSFPGATRFPPHPRGYPCCTPRVMQVPWLLSLGSDQLSPWFLTLDESASASAAPDFLTLDTRLPSAW